MYYESGQIQKKGNNLNGYYDGLWNVYSKESQYILNNAKQDSIVQIYEYKYYSHKDIFSRFTIVIDLKNETQQITYNNNDPITYNRTRNIKKIPIEIVQGRYDVVCPMFSAWDLHKALPNAGFHIIQNSGHSMLEDGIRKKLIEITDSI